MSIDIDEDDILPEPDDEPTAAERAHAKTFGDLVEKSLIGRTPAMMSADDRTLLDVATVIRAANGGMQLAPSTQRSIIEEALRKAIGEPVNTSGELPIVTPIRKPRRGWVPWAVASTSTLVAAAAVVLLMLRAPKIVRMEPAASLPASWKSRAADPLIGPIARAHAGDASARIDYIFADRLDGFRDRKLAGGKP